MKIAFYFLLFLFLISLEVVSQTPKKPSSNEIYHSIQKLNFLGSVLYVAAHPDDENTRLISYFSNQLHARTAYLSLTRGDGGQNLIGHEIRALLGVIRTNELLQARLKDGGEQFFTRAKDFGYSKNPEETLQIWNEKDILNDMVKVIRDFQPDIIINRFNVNSAGQTHGHHTSSAILSTKAFDLAANSNYKLNNSQPWKSNRLFFNTSWWFYGSKENFKKADKSKMLSVDTGIFYPSSGLSNSEIASLSRSMHKSQGFGNTGSRGIQKEYIELIKGDKPLNNNIFDGIDTTWNRVKGGQDIGKILTEVEINYDFKKPSKSVPQLLRAYQLIEKLENEHWRIIKIQEIESIIAACLGLYIEVSVNMPTATRNEDIEINIEAINRSEVEIEFNKIVLFSNNDTKKIEKQLKNNVSFTTKYKFVIPEYEILTNPYWLNEKSTLGMYKVQNESNIGKPLTPRNNKVIFKLIIEGVPVDFEREVIYKFNDPVKGEVYQPFEIVPEVSSVINSNVILFNEDSPKEIPIKITAHKDDIKGVIKMKIPLGWHISPNEIPFTILKKDDEKSLLFVITPSKIQSEGFIESIIESNGKTFTKSMIEISYDHIPKQIVFLPSKAKVVRLNIEKKGNIIGYIKGAGDEIPVSLQQIGYQVSIVDPNDISSITLKKYDAIIIGIRAYNINKSLINKQNILLDYVKDGGNLIVQYNTVRQLKVKENLAPYHLNISHDRVTDENAEVKFLDPYHEILNYPNIINEKDFDGWVQERGLYFPNEWAEEFTPLFSMHDKGDSPKEGSMLVAKYGKGNYIYTGLSFFRELPAGVPGAYKLFANMISLGKNGLDKEIKD